MDQDFITAAFLIKRAIEHKGSMNRTKSNVDSDLNQSVVGLRSVYRQRAFRYQ